MPDHLIILLEKISGLDIHVRYHIAVVCRVLRFCIKLNAVLKQVSAILIKFKLGNILSVAGYNTDCYKQTFLQRRIAHHKEELCKDVYLGVYDLFGNVDYFFTAYKVISSGIRI